MSTTLLDATQSEVSSPLKDLVNAFAKERRSEHRGDVEFKVLLDLVKGYAANPIGAKRGMRELLSRSPSKFYVSALQILRGGDTGEGLGPGLEMVVNLLHENELLLFALTDVESINSATAIALSHGLVRMDPHFDAKLLKHLLRDDHVTIFQVETVRMERVLEILDAVSDCTRLMPFLMKLQRHPEKRIQSKAALLTVRAHRNADWLQSQINSPDPRVRANAIEGMRATNPSDKEVSLLWKCTTDVHHRVASTALLVLFENGHSEKAAEALEKMANSLGEPYRAAAAWAMGETGDPRFIDQVRRMVRSDTGLARRTALKASVAITRKMQSVQNGEA